MPKNILKIICKSLFIMQKILIKNMWKMFIINLKMDIFIYGVQFQILGEIILFSKMASNNL